VARALTMLSTNSPVHGVAAMAVTSPVHRTAARFTAGAVAAAPLLPCDDKLPSRCHRRSSVRAILFARIPASRLPPPLGEPPELL
jgi:hypothetical protein